jgi:hypothetical protein
MLGVARKGDEEKKKKLKKFDRSKKKNVLIFEIIEYTSKYFYIFI